MSRVTIGLVRQAMRRPLPGPAAQRRMAPRPRVELPALAIDYRDAGVLLLLYPQGQGLSLALTRRCDHLAAHAGQISLPGGLREPEDASLAASALREAHEELGIDPRGLELLGPLSPVEIPVSAFRIHPWVAYAPARPAFRPDPAEVAELLEVPVDLLLDPATRAVEVRLIRGYEADVPYFLVYGHKVWGATAVVLGEFVALLESATEDE
jgi:8-oxo-dGTP pyrophosphatase MutT (NUDIX family)